MAIDTQDKRASAIVAGLYYSILLPLADGSIDQPDRQQLAGVYCGNAFLPPTSSGPQLLVFRSNAFGSYLTGRGVSKSRITN